MDSLKPKLKEVLKRVEHTARNGELPITIFDLDSTLFSIAARNLRILWEFAAAFQHEYPDVAEKVAQVSLADLGWSYKQPLIERWRQHYNRFRPHSALGHRPHAPEARMLIPNLRKIA